MEVISGSATGILSGAPGSPADTLLWVPTPVVSMVEPEPPAVASLVGPEDFYFSWASFLCLLLDMLGVVCLLGLLLCFMSLCLCFLFLSL